MTHLPVIVESTESTPDAAYAAVTQIRKYLGKDNFIYPYKQYNAIMLIRILVDNPGPIFTRSIDAKFEHTCRDVLRLSRDPSVQQLLRETLTNFEHTKKDMPGLTSLLKMWEKERASMPMPSPAQRASGIYSARPVHSNGRPRHALPGPEELSSRIEEAKTSAKLLMQFVSTTAPEEFSTNELIKEFADRCVSAQRSLQGYMHCTDPSPDEPTLQTLIETCEQLSLASSKHQRAMLAARRQNSTRSDSIPQTQIPPQAAQGPTGDHLLGSGPLQQAPQVPALQPMPSLAAGNAAHSYGNGQAAFFGGGHSSSADPFSDSNKIDSGFDTTRMANGQGSQIGGQPAIGESVVHTQRVDDDSEDDLYGATPMKTGNSAVMSDQHPPSSPTRVTAGNPQSRVKDDEPVNGGGVSVSGSGWNY